MSEIKVGSKWQRVNTIGAAVGIDTMHESVTVTRVADNCVDFRYDDPEIQEHFPKGLPSLTYDRFLEAFRELPSVAAVAPSADSWDYAEADRLRKAAADALAAYNAYADRKPTTAHYPVAIPWELL